MSYLRNQSPRKWITELAIIVLAAVMIFCVASIGFCQTASIEGPSTAMVGDLIVLDSSNSDKTGKVDWDIDLCIGAKVENVQTYVCGEKLIASTKRPGTYTFELIVSKGDLGVDKATHTIVVSQETMEPITPVVPVTPKPDPTNPTIDLAALRTAARSVPNDPLVRDQLIEGYLSVAKETYPSVDAAFAATKSMRQQLWRTRPSPKNPEWNNWLQRVNEKLNPAAAKVTNIEQFRQTIAAIVDGLKDSKANVAPMRVVPNITYRETHWIP